MVFGLMRLYFVPAKTRLANFFQGINRVVLQDGGNGSVTQVLDNAFELAGIGIWGVIRAEMKHVLAQTHPFRCGGLVLGQQYYLLEGLILHLTDEGVNIIKN